MVIGYCVSCYLRFVVKYTILTLVSVEKIMIEVDNVVCKEFCVFFLNRKFKTDSILS